RHFKEGCRGARRRGCSGRRGYEGRGNGLRGSAANQCVLPPAHAITAKSAAAAMARRVGRVSTTAVSTGTILEPFLKRAISPLSNLVKRFPSASLSNYETRRLRFLSSCRTVRDMKR